MISNYKLFVIIQMLSVHLNICQDCIEGEIWFERCKKCECMKNQFYICRWHLPSCNIETIPKGFVVFESNRRCHFAVEKQKTVCVGMKFQKDLNGKPCAEQSYLHDSCTFCRCEQSTRTFECESINKCSATNGICDPRHTVMENICYECSCTFTRFRLCSPLQQCFYGIEKVGKCPIHQNVYSAELQDICTHERYQECYADFGCPGTKKCCHIDCFLRCVEAIN